MLLVHLAGIVLPYGFSLATKLLHDVFVLHDVTATDGYCSYPSFDYPNLHFAEA